MTARLLPASLALPILALMVWVWWRRKDDARTFTLVVRIECEPVVAVPTEGR